jgi:hypothetical protein
MLQLGKDCAIAIGSLVANAIVRDVAWNSSAKSVEYQPFGQRKICTHTTGYTCSLEVTCVEDPGMQSPLASGESVTVTSSSGYSGAFKVVNVSRSEPLDGLVTATIQMEQSLA